MKNLLLAIFSVSMLAACQSETTTATEETTVVDSTVVVEPTEVTTEVENATVEVTVTE
jgi:uncharacterized protein YcfL